MTRAEPSPTTGFVLASLLAAVVAVTVAVANGGAAGLLTVGENFPARDYIVAQLGDVELAAGAGHDGQQYFAIARDPLGLGEVPDLVDNPGYRYLHIAYPALAGGFGLLSPDMTVALMIALALGGFGLAAAGSVRLAAMLDGVPAVAMLAAGNLGLLLAVRFLLPDALALGLAMLGTTLAVRGQDRRASAALALATLTKPTYFVFPLALGIWAGRRDLRRVGWLTMVPAATAALWASYVFARFGFSTGGNLELPLAGIGGAVALWGEQPVGQIAMAALALALIVLGLWLAATDRSSILSWLLIGWAGIGIASSELVWEFGNNVLRVTAPLWSLTAAAAAVYLSSRRSRRNLPV